MRKYGKDVKSYIVKNGPGKGGGGGARPIIGYRLAAKSLKP